LGYPPWKRTATELKEVLKITGSDILLTLARHSQREKCEHCNTGIKEKNQRTELFQA